MSRLSILNALSQHTESVPRLFFRNNYSYVIIVFKDSLPREEATNIKHTLKKFGRVLSHDDEEEHSTFRVIAQQ